MSTLQNIIIAAVIVSFVLSGFLFVIDELNDSSTYNAQLHTTNISSIEKLEELRGEAKNLSVKVTEGSEVTTQESEASFFTNAFTVGKFIITGKPFTIIDGMIRDGARVLGLPIFFYYFLSTILILILAFALIKSITGR